LYWIHADPIMMFAPIAAVEGGIAHELSHISMGQTLSPYKREQEVKLSQKDLLYRTLDEIATDLDVIRRGGIRSLYSFTVFAEKNKQRKGILTREDGGLSLKEIKGELSHH